MDNMDLTKLFPSPDLAKQYEVIQPGFLQWQMDLIKAESDRAERSTQAAIDFDKERLRLESEMIKRGQKYGLAIGIFALAAGSITAILGAELSGGLIGSGGVIGLVAVFIFGRRSSNVDKS